MFSENTAFPLQFPLILQEPLIIYQEQSEGNGKWSKLKYLEIQIPSQWDMSGDIVDHKSYFIFNYDIFKQLEQAQQQGLFRDSNASNEAGSNNVFQETGIQAKYNLITRKQKNLFMSTNFNQRSEILLTYQTDLHYCSTIDYFKKKPYYINAPPDVKDKDYQYLFFKRLTDKEELLIDIVGFSRKEKRMDLILAFLMKYLVYEVRYSKEGIIKQVEDAVERIFMQVLKHIFRYISKAMQIKEYRRMIELVYYVLVNNRQEYEKLFSQKEDSPLFCKNIRLLKKDVSSIVYKVMITEGLFPINCEINTMDDSYIKLKLLSLVADAEVLPWSPKFHASLALNNFHYSFTPNDVFNQKTLKTRRYNKKYQYVNMKVLDFFPLDQWVDLISVFFQENLFMILQYIGEYMDNEVKQRRVPSESEESKYDKTVSSGKIGLKEPLIQNLDFDKNLINQSSRTSSNQTSQRPETELICDQIKSVTKTETSTYIQIVSAVKQSKQSVILAQEFKPKDVIFEQSSIFDTISDNKEQQAQHKKQLQHFKNILIRSMKRVNHQSRVYNMMMATSLMQKIKTQIADEFQQTYRYELEVSGILTQFCQIITETELMSYSIFGNNCQTPVAAFIYTLCDKFRPFSESLDPQLNFLKQCNEFGYQCAYPNDPKDNKPKTKDLNDLSLRMSKIKQPHIEQLQKQFNRVKSNLMLSKISTAYYHSEFESKLSQYLRYASCNNLLLMGQKFIQPAVLEKALDYFGFYGDDLSAEFLKKMQNIDANPNSFAEPPLVSSGFFGKKSQLNQNDRSLPYNQVSKFQKLQQDYDDKFFSNYANIIDSYEKSYQTDQTTTNEIQQFQNSFEKDGEDKREDKEMNQATQLEMHYLLIHFQNKLIQVKQADIKNASKKHHQQQLYQETCYIYYNSIRLQLTSKVRKNSLSYIGFLLAKDLDKFSNNLPENVTFQTLV